MAIWVIRHGETAWSLSGQHTGWADIPLTEHGREQAKGLSKRLQGHKFALVLVSPLQRAAETCRLAGFTNAQNEPNLREWNYGAYEGKTREQIVAARPDWDLWRDGVEGGERIEETAARADRVIERVEGIQGDVALFAHGHILRILASRWLGLAPQNARLFALETAAIGILGHERETRVLRGWNVG